MTHWEPADANLWQGRDDSAEAENALRLFQTIALSQTFSPNITVTSWHYWDLPVTKGLNVIMDAPVPRVPPMRCEKRWQTWQAMPAMSAWSIWGIFWHPRQILKGRSRPYAKPSRSANAPECALLCSVEGMKRPSVTVREFLMLFPANGLGS